MQNIVIITLILVFSEFLTANPILRGKQEEPKESAEEKPYKPLIRTGSISYDFATDKFQGITGCAYVNPSWAIGLSYNSQILKEQRDNITDVETYDLLKTRKAFSYDIEVILTSWKFLFGRRFPRSQRYE